MEESKVILFDGYCHLCDGTVSFLFRIDRKKQFKFAALQSDFGKKILEKHPKLVQIDSIIFLEKHSIYVKSGAVLHILKYLPWYVSWIRILGAFPSSILDQAYDFVATNRYRVLGKRSSCRTPTAAEKARFIA